MARLVLLFILLPSFIAGQNSYKGKVIDQRTNVPVPYATVALLKENIGVNADEHGNFYLSSKKQVKDDSLIFSSIGYETKMISCAAVFQDATIGLTERIKPLKEVLVLNKTNWRTTVLNRFSGCGNYTITTMGIQSELAQHFYAPRENVLLKKVEICIGLGLFYNAKATFRIRVYDIDSLTGKPSSDLVNEPIEVTTAGSRATVNLESYHIVIPRREFFVAVEWLMIPSNAEATTDGYPLYKPHLGAVSSKDRAGDQVWMLLFNNSWVRDSFSERLRIEATVKY